MATRTKKSPTKKRTPREAPARAAEKAPSTHYDVVIMGGGILGNAQARHLVLHVPGIRVALVEPRSPEEIIEDRKVGESLIEISAMFMTLELDLWEYFIDHQRTKHGLNYHWPRDPAHTRTMDDYFSIWQPYLAPIPSFQIHRGVLERDLLLMNQASGVAIVRGSVKDFTLDPTGRHTVEVELASEGGKKAGSRAPRATLTAEYVVDASGRRQLIGKRLGNVVRDAEHVAHLETGASWVRARNVDRAIFKRTQGPLPTLSSRYYGTNHFMGKGHWIWMIPIAGDEVSIGVVYHKQKMDPDSVRTQEGLLAFFRKHHTVLADLLASGELVDHRLLTRLPHVSKTYISQDRWSVIGDAGFFLDPFYSTGIAIGAMQVECNTRIIQRVLAGRDTRSMVDTYDRFIFELIDKLAMYYYKHHEHLGHASAMSWRIYLEFLRYSGEALPMYMGKFFLSEKHARLARLGHSGFKRFFELYYDTLDEVVRTDANIGFPDPYIHDLFKGGMSPVYHAYVEKDRHHDPERLNLMFCLGWSHFTSMRCLATITRRTYGARGLLKPRHVLVQAENAVYGSIAMAGAVLHRLTNAGKPRNAFLGKREAEFASYHSNDAFYTDPFYMPPAERRMG